MHPVNVQWNVSMVLKILVSLLLHNKIFEIQVIWIYNILSIVYRLLTNVHHHINLLYCHTHNIYITAYTTTRTRLEKNIPQSTWMMCIDHHSISMRLILTLFLTVYFIHYVHVLTIIIFRPFHFLPIFYILFHIITSIRPSTNKRESNHWWMLFNTYCRSWYTVVFCLCPFTS